MKWRRNGDRVFVVLPRGASILEGIHEAADAADVTSGSLTGIGAAQSVRLAWYDRYEHKYRERTLDGVWEIASLIGNITWYDEALRIHCHMVVSDRDCDVKAGHLVAAVVAVTCEIAITPYEDPLVRKMSTELGLPLIDLS